MSPASKKKRDGGPVITLRLTPALLEALTRFCKERGINRNEAIKAMIRHAVGCNALAIPHCERVADEARRTGESYMRVWRRRQKKGGAS